MVGVLLVQFLYLLTDAAFGVIFGDEVDVANRIVNYFMQPDYVRVLKRLKHLELLQDGIVSCL